MNLNFTRGEPRLDFEIRCPFNPNHQMPESRLQWHITNKCQDAKKRMHEFARCRFNCLHYIIKHDIQDHEAVCPDKPKPRNDNQGAQDDEIMRQMQQAVRQQFNSQRKQEAQQRLVQQRNEQVPGLLVQDNRANAPRQQQRQSEQQQQQQQQRMQFEADNDGWDAVPGRGNRGRRSQPQRPQDQFSNQQPQHRQFQNDRDQKREQEQDNILAKELDFEALLDAEWQNGWDDPFVDADNPNFAVSRVDPKIIHNEFMTQIDSSRGKTGESDIFVGRTLIGLNARNGATTLVNQLRNNDESLLGDVTGVNADWEDARGGFVNARVQQQNTTRVSNKPNSPQKSNNQRNNQAHRQNEDLFQDQLLNSVQLGSSIGFEPQNNNSGDFQSFMSSNLDQSLGLNDSNVNKPQRGQARRNKQQEQPRARKNDFDNQWFQ